MLTYSLDALHEIRSRELSAVFAKHGKLFDKSDVLEIGTGPGFQLEMIQRIARMAVGVDIPSSEYRTNDLANVVIFDGAKLPFADQSFDLIYSSNVMEHVIHEPLLHREMQRVLRPTGVAIHVVPSSSWRLWTMLVHYVKVPELFVRVLHQRSQPNDIGRLVPTTNTRSKSYAKLIAAALCPPRHGERGNRLTEWWHFRSMSWRRRFDEFGWDVESIRGAGLFYTGYLVAPRHMSSERRQRWSTFLGSASLICFLRPKSSRTALGRTASKRSDSHSCA